MRRPQPPPNKPHFTFLCTSHAKWVSFSWWASATFPHICTPAVWNGPRHSARVLSRGPNPRGAGRCLPEKICPPDKLSASVNDGAVSPLLTVNNVTVNKEPSNRSAQKTRLCVPLLTKPWPEAHRNLTSRPLAAKVQFSLTQCSW